MRSSSTIFDPVNVEQRMVASSSSSGGGCKYDVFLSFRGEDTRKIFVGHLYRALRLKAINTFIDSQELQKGHRILELLTAIEESRLSIVVLSENYASSTWCLKELIKIMDCMDYNNQMVVPVFYQVDPSHIRKIQGNFAQAFTKHEDNSKDELEKWRSALTRVADLSGWDSRKYEDDGKLIEEIVENIFIKLMHTSSIKANGLVGMDSHIREMMSRLCLHVKEVLVIGIWGMGGLGKTTIARAVYNEIASQFEHSCFVDNVKEAFKNKREPQLQEEVLSRLLNEKVQTLGLNRGWHMIKARLGTRRVLVVLDDVETYLQIEALLGQPHAFGGGSRVIVTTRDKQSLIAADETYEPMCLSNDVALVLFRKTAFKKNQSNGDYDHLSRRAIEYAQGLPLALRVLGAFLHGKSVCEWEAVLQKLRKIPHMGIQDVLRTSFDGLDDSEKDMFLDIACLFREWDIDLVTEILDSCGFIPGNGLKVLRDRALITVSESNKVYMHDLLHDMGREIVRLESPKEPGKCSRVWSYEDVVRVLTENTATAAVECLILDLSKSEVDICIHTEAFARMKKLRLLMIYYTFDFIFDYAYYIDNDSLYRCREELCPVDGCRQLLMGELLEFLSHELRILIWHGCMLKSLPSTFIPKNLVTLDMRGSHLQQLWEGIKKLYLARCSSLIEVHSSVFALQNLYYLTLRDCKALKSLPGSIQMKSLPRLLLNGCSNLENFPEISPITSQLTYIDLSDTAIKQLPSSINNVTRVRHLILRGCTELKTLSPSIGMTYLRTLNLDGCTKLEKFPEISGIMKELTELRLDGTVIKELPSSINLLKGIRKLSMRNCKNLEFLTDSACDFGELTHLDLSGCSELKTLSPSIDMRSLRTLKLDDCSKLEKFPEITGIMKWLPKLQLDATAIKELPSSIDLLLGIQKLSMRNCERLEFLPNSICNLAALTHLDLFGCSFLHNLPERLGDLQSLQVLEVCFSGIKQLPFSILRLRKLGSLSCTGCKKMTAPLSAWPSSVEDCCTCSLLLDLDLTDCNMLELSQLPSIALGDRLSCTGCKRMTAGSSSCFSVLVHLDLSDCGIWELSDGIAYLSSLQTLQLCRNHLRSLPATMNRLDRLTHLELEACKRLKSIPELSSSIYYINAHDCVALEIVANPKPRFQANYFFNFGNCYQLVQTNLFVDIVERHSRFQDNYMRSLQLQMSLPGHAVPDWFNHQTEGFSVSVQVPPDWLGRKVHGFAICAVRKYHPFMCPLSVPCSCTLKGNRGEHSVTFDLLISSRFLGSDHMFLGYVSRSMIERGSLVNDTYSEATFRIEVVSNLKTEQLCIGVRCVYANPEEMLNLNMALPQTHVESCESGVSFMDSSELRNKETKRVEIPREIESSGDQQREVQNESMGRHVEGLGVPLLPHRLKIRMSGTECEAKSSALGEGSGTYPTLEPSPEPQTDREEEDDREVLRSAFSLRKRDTEPEGDRVSDDGDLSEEDQEMTAEESMERVIRATVELLLLASK